MVFYTWNQSNEGTKFDPGFGKNIAWDIPLLEGYDFTFVKNTSANPGSKKYSGIKNPSLIKEIKKWNPDALLVIGWNFQSHWRSLRYFHEKIPVFFRGDSTLLNEKRGIRTFCRRIVLTWVYRHIDCAFYVGTQNRKYFLRHGVKETQLIWVPHAIDNDRFAKDADELQNKALIWRKELGISSSKIVILFAGKFEETKNLEILINAAIALKNHPIHFVLVGNGPLENKLKDKSDSLNITFLDFQNQQAMPLIYRLGDVYILPSVSETWGLGVNEAMACARPILVSDLCGCAIDLVEPNQNGFIFRSGNMTDLIQKIQFIQEHKDKLYKMGQISFQKIQNWSFEKLAEQIENAVLSFK